MGLTLEDQVTLPVILINDGRLLRKNLTACGKDEAWLHHQLASRRISSPRQVFLLTLDDQGELFFVKKEDTAS